MTSRRRRRAKTDRIDGEALLRALMAYKRGEPRVGDGVNFLAGAPGVVGLDITANGIARNFPFLPTPYDGKNRVHVDCGETGPGGNPCGPLVP
jgi:hypothetical protein